MLQVFSITFRYILKTLKNTHTRTRTFSSICTRCLILLRFIFNLIDMKIRYKRMRTTHSPVFHKVQQAIHRKSCRFAYNIACGADRSLFVSYFILILEKQSEKIYLEFILVRCRWSQYVYCCYEFSLLFSGLRRHCVSCI